MTALEYFRQFAPDFNTLNDDVVGAWLASALVFVPAPATAKATLMQALYAAHLCWLRKYSAGMQRGTVANEKDGELSKSYNALRNSDTFLGQSSYGMQYLELKGGIFRTPSIITRFGAP